MHPGHQADAQQPDQGEQLRRVHRAVRQGRGQQAEQSPAECRAERVALVDEAGEHGEGGEGGQRGEQAEHGTADAVHRGPAGPARRTLLGPDAFGAAQLDGGRTGPALAGRDLAGDGGAGHHLGALADAGAGQQRRAGADDGAGADLDLADEQLVAVQPVAAQVHLGLDRAAAAQLQHPGERRERVQVHLGRDLAAQRAGVAHQPGAGQ